MEKLAVIIPVYNEEKILQTVLNEWVEELNKLEIEYNIFAYNDGSNDKSLSILEKTTQNNSNITVINKENSGHGPTILKGYKENSLGFDWIFQVDSDNEMSAKDFKNLWEKRAEYDFLCVIRKNRSQSFVRHIISLFSRFCIRLFYGKSPFDANSPYRLMRTEKFVDLFNLLPSDTICPNLIISGYIAKKKLKFYEYYIKCAGRQTGEISLKNIKLLKTVIISFLQTIFFSFIVK